MPGGLMLHIPLHGVVRFPCRHSEVAPELIPPGPHTLTVKPVENRLGSIPVHGGTPARFAGGITVHSPEKLDHVHPAAFERIDRRLDRRPSVPQGAETGDQLVHPGPQAPGMSDADRRSLDHPHDCHVLANVPVQTHASMERTAIVSGVEDNAGKNVVIRSEHSLSLFPARLNRQIVAVVEVGPAVGHPVESSRCGLGESQNVIGLVRQIPPRHGIADHFAVVRAEQPVERRPQTIGAAQRKLLDREIESRTHSVKNRGHDLLLGGLPWRSALAVVCSISNQNILESANRFNVSLERIHGIPVDPCPPQIFTAAGLDQPERNPTVGLRESILPVFRIDDIENAIIREAKNLEIHECLLVTFFVLYRTRRFQ